MAMLAVFALLKERNRVSFIQDRKNNVLDRCYKRVLTVDIFGSFEELLPKTKNTDLKTFWHHAFDLLVCFPKEYSNTFVTSRRITKRLTLSWQRPLSYRNQSTDLLCKSLDWFLYDNGLRHERVKAKAIIKRKSKKQI